MYGKFKIDGLKTQPALKSEHTKGFAVDMEISWEGTLTIEGKDGSSNEISSKPRGPMNTELHAIGAGYGVLRYFKPALDKPHWSLNAK